MPDFEIEDSLNCMVAGVDEAGRGPWAGPVVAGAVIIRDRNLGDELLKGLDDSKKISAKNASCCMKNCGKRRKTAVCLSASDRQALRKLTAATFFRPLLQQ